MKNQGLPRGPVLDSVLPPEGARALSVVREVHNHAWGSQKKHKHGKQRQSEGCATDRVFDKMKRAVVHLWGSRYWGSPWKLIWRIYGWNRTVSEVCFRTTRRVVGAMHGQPGVCVQSLVLVMGLLRAFSHIWRVHR